MYCIYIVLIVNMPKGKGGKKLRDQVRQQQELEQQGFKNLVIKKQDETIIDEETGIKTIIYTTERYCKVTRNNGSKRYECVAEEAPGKSFTKHKVRKMGRLDHKRHRQKIIVGNIALIYIDKEDKPDKDGNYGGEIFHQYSEREAIELINRGEISDNLWTQNKAETETDDFNPFYFENDEFKSNEELKQEKLDKANSGSYFNYDFDSGEEGDVDETLPQTTKTNEIEEVDSDTKIDDI